MLDHDEYAAVQADAYIDALIARSRAAAVPAPREVHGLRAPLDARDPALRAADLLGALPRFHPSFAFEEALATRLRQLADGTVMSGGRLAEIIPFPAVPLATGAMPIIDRRLLVGGAIASGVSVAVIAWWQSGRRRPEVLA